MELSREQIDAISAEVKDLNKENEKLRLKVDDLIGVIDGMARNCAAMVRAYQED